MALTNLSSLTTGTTASRLLSCRNVQTSLTPASAPGSKIRCRSVATRFASSYPATESANAYYDRELLVLTRAVVKAQEWGNQSPEYKKLHKKYQKDLRDKIKERFDRFAVLETWNFTAPSQCRFLVESFTAQGSRIPEAIETCLKDNVFVPEDFERIVTAAASQNDSVSKLLRELQEPRPNEEECIPWLGETQMKERIIRLCASGLIAINLRGMEYLQVEAGEDEEAAWRGMRGRLGTGKHLEETFVLLPQAIPQTHGVNKEQTSAGIPGSPPTDPYAGGNPPGGSLFDPTPHQPGGGTPPRRLFKRDPHQLRRTANVQPESPG